MQWLDNVTDLGNRYNAKDYVCILKKILRIKYVMGNNNWVFRQDGAPAHRFNKAQKWSIQFGPWQCCPPHNPDLEFAMWAHITAKAYKQAECEV